MQRIVLKTPVFTLAFANLFKPVSLFDHGSRPKYTATAMFADDSLLSTLRVIAYEEGVDRFGDKTVFKLPFKQGSKGEHYDFSMFTVMNFSSVVRPLVYEETPDQNRYMGAEETVFNGCLCIAEISPFSYDYSGHKGVGFQLLTLTRIADPEMSEDQAQLLAVEQAFITRAKNG